MLKAREVREKLRGRVDPEVAEVLEMLTENYHQQAKTLVELASMVSMAIEACESFNMVAEGMKKKIDEMQNPVHPELGPVTQ